MADGSRQWSSPTGPPSTAPPVAPLTGPPCAPPAAEPGAHAAMRSAVHDINNLLFAISGQSELIVDGAVDNAAEAAREILDAARTAAALCRRLLIDEPPAVDARLDVEAIVRRILRRAPPKDGPIDVSIDLAAPEPPGCDVLRLQQGLANLVSNAQAAMPNGGRLTVTTVIERLGCARVDTLGETLAPGRYWVLAVRDTGTGIAAGRLRQLFEPGYTTRSEPTAHGFGLSVVAEAARWHRGGVMVASTPGEGSRFAMWLPIGG